MAGLMLESFPADAIAPSLHPGGSPRRRAAAISGAEPEVLLHVLRAEVNLAVCRDCGAIQELDDAPLAAALDVVADRTGYRVRERVIELVGACPTCAKTSQEPTVG